MAVTAVGVRVSSSAPCRRIRQHHRRPPYRRGHRRTGRSPRGPTRRRRTTRPPRVPRRFVGVYRGARTAQCFGAGPTPVLPTELRGPLDSCMLVVVPNSGFTEVECGAADRPSLGHQRPLFSEGRRTIPQTEPEQLPGPNEPASRKEGPVTHTGGKDGTGSTIRRH